MSSNIIIRKNYDLASAQSLVSMASVLKSHIVKQNLFTQISNKNYAHVEGWQFAGGLLGLVARIASVEKLGTGTWRADAEIINIKTGDVVSRGIAICTKEETRKRSFEEYAILSMAQTRAIGKAYRNMIGWVMKTAGYEGTPSEEMTKVGQETEKTVTYDDAPDHVCGKCKTPISEQEAAYSKKMFGKELCSEHQEKARAVLKAKKSKK